MSKITITFFAIVKNEEKIIERCLESIKSIADYIVISDTGSTDNTVQKIEDFIIKNNKKGKVYKNDWLNFGHNRTLSITNARDWLDSENIDKSTNYLLTIDADMQLIVEPNFNKQSLSTKKSWIVEQYNSILSYFNSRIFRADINYKCIGVTHEYWTYDGDDGIFSKFEFVKIHDIGDGGAKADKYERDIRLLKQGIDDEPNNVRYFFYIAQSYLDMHDYENAKIWYKKRIDAKGWNEEILIACTRLGEIYMKLDEPEKALAAWADGYNYNNKRAESLLRIVNYYRNTNKQELAMLYLRQMARIDYPKDQILFIEHMVYEYGFYEELSICAAYTNSKNCGLMACNYIIFKKVCIELLRNLALNNIFYYTGKFLWKTRQIIQIPEINRDIWKSSSSCLLQNGKNIIGNVRAVNYSIDDNFQYTIRDEKQKVKTKNFWCNFKQKESKVLNVNELSIHTCYELICTVPPIRESHIEGLEDLRIVKFNKKYYGLAVTFQYCRNDMPSIALCHINPDKTGKMLIDKVVPISFDDMKMQKNWVPFVENNKICAIYSHHPLIILELNVDDGSSKILYNKFSEFNLSNIRGSSIPIKIKNEWYMVVHEVVQKETRKYYNRIVKYSDKWDLLDISNPFYFQDFFVEFCLSIYEENGMLYIPYSIRDNSTEIVSIELKSIQWIPKDIKKYICENI